jgi:hypothetical protein
MVSFPYHPSPIGMKNHLGVETEGLTDSEVPYGT